MKSLGQRAAGARLERMQGSPRWSGEGFRNLHPIAPGLRSAVPMPGMLDLLRPKPPRLPGGTLPLVDPRPAWLRRPGSGLRATWLGHSTVLLEIDGWRVLTDPVWGQRASPSTLVGPKRFHPAPVALRDVPDVDVVVISHDHYDHLDYPTIRALAASRVPFVTSLGVGAHLQGWGIAPARITELDWWESHTVPGTGLTVTAAPSQHFSGRTFKTRNATLWSSMVMRGPRHAVFFSGDTGLTDEYAVIRDRLGPFDLALLEVGAWFPAWGDMHLGPDNALQALAQLGNPPLLPVHWSTFALAMHDWDQPAERLLELAPHTGARLVMPRLGEAVQPAQAEGVNPWWRAVNAPARGHALQATPAPERTQDHTPTAAPRAATELDWPGD
ncbi:MAG: MBL fold metallo-hydrolase [Ottowia sp.]|nr:MBL fold metallo-hydrolase [Ottowia sp.]